MAGTDPTSPEELIRGCIRKDKRSWDIFVERYSKVIYWAIRDRLKRLGYQFDEQDIEDIHQDVFIALWGGDKLSKLKDGSKLAGWLAIVAANAAVDYFRYRKRQSPPNSISIYQEIYSDGEGGVKTLEDLLPAKDTDPAKQLKLDDIRRAIEKEIEGLKPKERIAVKLDLFKGMKNREIAEALGMRLDSLSTLLSRAKTGMRKRLEEKNI